MVGLAGIGSAAVIAGGFGRLLQRRFDVGSERAAIALPNAESSETLAADTELGVEGIASFVTPNADFYRIDTALVVPQVSKDSWTLKIDGLVDNPMELTFDDLLARPQIERYITLSCVSNEVGGDLVGNALLAGRAAEGPPRRGRAPGRRRPAGEPLRRRLDVRHAARRGDGRP